MFFRLNFKDHAAEEGESFRRKERIPCPTCGLKILRGWTQYPVSDDEVEDLDALFWEVPKAPLIYCAGCLMARTDLQHAMRATNLNGYSFRPATAAMMPDVQPASVPSYAWMVVTGRCNVTDVYTHAEFCSECGWPREKPFDATTRLPHLVAPLPACDLSWPREQIIGLIVSERFKRMLEQFEGLEEFEFKPIALRS